VDIEPNRGSGLIERCLRPYRYLLQSMHSHNSKLIRRITLAPSSVVPRKQRQPPPHRLVEPA
jgi:hypothetical protein